MVASRIKWHELASLSERELAQIDLAATHLSCAEGLPGAESIDTEYCLRWLDQSAATVRCYTELAYEQFFLTNPEKFQHSMPLFRMVCLGTALQNHCGVHYNPDKRIAKETDPFDLEDEFIHGIIQGPGGTCANLPIVYAAVGRRLGYPMKLVGARRHLFCRWEDPGTGERLNFEGAGEGMSFYPDEHYRTWPVAFDEEEEKKFGYLQSWSPRQELAYSIGMRAFRWMDTRNYSLAVETFAIASELTNPLLTNPLAMYSGLLASTVIQWREWTRSRMPPRFPPQIEIRRRPGRRWPDMPAELEEEIYGLRALERCLNDARWIGWWWQPLRFGHPPLRPFPATLIAEDY